MCARPWLPAIVCLLCLSGCIDRANLAAKMIDKASAGAEQIWDYEFARQALPSSILRLEGLLRASPDNELLLQQLVRAYSAYAFAFVEDEVEEAEFRGDFEEADHLRERCRYLYLRALGYGKRLLSAKAEGLQQAIESGPEPFKAWVAEHFDDPEEDVPALFWTGYAWGLSVKATGGDPASLVDLPYARALVERSVELDERFFNAAGHTFLGTIEATIPPALGGNPEIGKAHFERALALTERRALTVQLSYARSYAANTYDEELFTSLLTEVVEAGDVLPEARLANKVAQRQARRLLRNMSEFF